MCVYVVAVHFCARCKI